MNSSSYREPGERAAAGRALRGRAQGAHTDALGAALADLDPELLDWADEFIFGSVWSRPGLEFEDRMLVAIVALASTGELTQLRNYLHGALQTGISPERLRESLVMLVIYVGFPRAIGAIATFKKVLESYERSA